MFVRFIAALTFALVLPGWSQAKTMQVVLGGTVQEGTDQGGFFGLGPDAALGGLAFTLTSVFDTSIGLREKGWDPLGPFDLLTGGSYSDLANPYWSASLTINGVSRAIGTGNASVTSLFQDDMRGVNWFYQDLTGFTSGDPATGPYTGGWVNILLAAAEGNPIDLETPRALTALESAGGAFEVFSFDPATGGRTRAFGFLQIETFRIAAVPLPASGVLVLGPLAVLGLMRWRRPRGSV